MDFLNNINPIGIIISIGYVIRGFFLVLTVFTQRRRIISLDIKWGIFLIVKFGNDKVNNITTTAYVKPKIDIMVDSDDSESIIESHDTSEDSFIEEVSQSEEINKI